MRMFVITFQFLTYAICYLEITAQDYVDQVISSDVSNLQNIKCSAKAKSDSSTSKSVKYNTTNWLVVFNTNT